MKGARTTPTSPSDEGLRASGVVLLASCSSFCSGGVEGPVFPGCHALIRRAASLPPVSEVAPPFPPAGLGFPGFRLLASSWGATLWLSGAEVSFSCRHPLPGGVGSLEGQEANPTRLGPLFLGLHLFKSWARLTISRPAPLEE